MSPKNRKKLEKVRKKLDRLDNEFLRLIKIRTDLVNEVIKLKEFKGEIVDTKRIKKILFNIRRKSLKKKNRFYCYLQNLEKYDFNLYKS